MFFRNLHESDAITTVPRVTEITAVCGSLVKTSRDISAATITIALPIKNKINVAKPRNATSITSNVMPNKSSHCTGGINRTYLIYGN